MDILTLLFSIATFLTVVLLLEGGYLYWRSTRSAEARRVAQRLEEVSGTSRQGKQQRSLLKQRNLAESPFFDELLTRMPHVRGLERLLTQSRLPWSVGQFIGWTVVLALFGLALPLFFNRPLVFGLIGAVVLGALPAVRVLRAYNKHLCRMEQQLPEALDLMARGLRAGHAFPTAVKMVADEMKAPIAVEFRILFDEMNYGVPQPTALLNMAGRTNSPDLGYFVIAVLIQRESGGNLAELLDNIGSIVRARLKLYGEIRTLSAEGRLSAWILSALPFVVAALVNLVNPGFMKVLWEDPVGINLIYAALFMMALGIFWMRKIIRIRV